MFIVQHSPIKTDNWMLGPNLYYSKTPSGLTRHNHADPFV